MICTTIVTNCSNHYTPGCTLYQSITTEYTHASFINKRCYAQFNNKNLKVRLVSHSNNEQVGIIPSMEDNLLSDKRKQKGLRHNMRQCSLVARHSFCNRVLTGSIPVTGLRRKS